MGLMYLFRLNLFSAVSDKLFIECYLFEKELPEK